MNDVARCFWNQELANLNSYNGYCHDHAKYMSPLIVDCDSLDAENRVTRIHRIVGPRHRQKIVSNENKNREGE